MRRDRLYDWGTAAFVLEIIGCLVHKSSDVHANRRRTPESTPRPALVKVINPEEEKASSTNVVTTVTAPQPTNVQKQPQRKGPQGR